MIRQEPVGRWAVNVLDPCAPSRAILVGYPRRLFNLSEAAYAPRNLLGEYDGEMIAQAPTNAAMLLDLLSG